MEKISLTLLACFCRLLSIGVFAFNQAIANPNYTNADFTTRSMNEVWHCKVEEYVGKCVPALNEDEKWCKLGKRPIIIGYSDNLVSHFRFGNGDYENPILSIDSVRTNVYIVSNFNKRLYVNFSKKDDIDALLDFCQSPPGFTMFAREYVRPYIYQEFNGNAVCYYRVEYPDEIVPKSDFIRRWLIDYASHVSYWNDEVELSNYTPYLGNESDESIAKHFAVRFFDYTDQDFANTEFGYDMRVYDYNERYVTYQQYTYCYLGGIHGFYTERLASFDMTTGEGITTDYLFPKKYQQKIRELLMETAFMDETFCSWNNIETMEDVIRCFMPETMTIPNIIASFDSTYVQPNIRLERVDISRVGLTSEGIVFSYYPYELSCYAAGCFHFTIPYKKNRLYLTEKAKYCIGID